MQSTDILIIGAGTAGLSALNEVRKATDDFLVVNDGDWGTTCATTGCMPSKAMIEAANAIHARHRLADFGIAAGRMPPDIPAVLRHVRRLRDDFASGPASTPDALGEKAIRGRARLVGRNAVEVNGLRIEARAIILATGSHPVEPAPWRGFADRVVTTDNLFDLDDLPRRIAVLGLGFVGIELAQALARLGCQVDGFDATTTLAGIDDEKVRAACHALIAEEVELHLGADASLAQADNGALRVRAGSVEIEADMALAAVGRAPNIDGLGLDRLGVALDDDGVPEVDATTLRIGDLPVYLAGDANGIRPLLHETADEGYLAARHALAETSDGGAARRVPMSITFTTPPVARVGPPLSDLPADKIVSAEADFSRQARARMSGEAAGLLRVHAERDSGRLVAAEMCVPRADHLAHFLALAIENRLDVGEILATPVYHPVIEEGLRGALRRLQRALPSGHFRPGLAQCDDVGFRTLD